MIDFDKLKAPFPPDNVDWRIGSKAKDGSKAMALAYIDARTVMDRLDDVCGPENWQCRYSHAGDKKTVCEIGIKTSAPLATIVPMGQQTPPQIHGDPEWVWKADGAGDSDIEADKGALSDAFKRAAVRWGIGRYLYALPSPWVSLDPTGRFIPAHELERLWSLLPNAAPGLKVSALTGQAKVPAKFWEKPKLTIAYNARFNGPDGKYTPEGLKDVGQEIKRWIDKAQTRADLASLHADNIQWFDQFNPLGAEWLREAFEVRATQFDQDGAA